MPNPKSGRLSRYPTLTNRTEILHFRATPEEKEAIRKNAGHAEVALSTWMRERSLAGQPPVFASLLLADEKSKPRASETYEQFMERRTGELAGENPTLAVQEAATEAAEREWAHR